MTRNALVEESRKEMIESCHPHTEIKERPWLTGGNENGPGARQPRLQSHCIDDKRGMGFEGE
jgi:hypothetical protein